MWCVCVCVCGCVCVCVAHCGIAEESEDLEPGYGLLHPHEQPAERERLWGRCVTRRCGGSAVAHRLERRKPVACHELSKVSALLDLLDL